MPDGWHGSQNMKTSKVEQIISDLLPMSVRLSACLEQLPELYSRYPGRLRELQMPWDSLRLAQKLCQALELLLSPPSLESTAEESFGGSITS